MTSLRSPRGFSMVELVVAMGVTVFVLAAAVAAANAQQRAFHDGQRSRVPQDSARTASIFIQQKLPLAGYGMDPSLAIDFSYYGCATQAGCMRDSTAGPDELVFYARNPNYWVPEDSLTGPYQGRVWSLTSINAGDTTATISARNGDSFLPKQIMQVVCPGTLKYAYFTVSAAATATADGDLPLTLSPVVAANPFRRQDVARTGGMAGCRVFEIDTYRFYVKPIAQGGGRYVPYLALDRGTDEVLIAEGIEDLQVAYTLASPALGRAGASAGTPISFSTALPDQSPSVTPAANLIARTNFPGAAPVSGQTLYAPSSYFGYGFSDARRQNSHQANIRSIQIALVARSPDPDPSTRTNLVVNSTFTLLNQSGAPAWVTGEPQLAFGTDGYQRHVSTFTVDLPNMTTRSIAGF